MEPVLLVYLSILERSQDPVALRLGIIYSELFSDDLKDRARSLTSLEGLRSIIVERRRLLESA